MAQLRHIQLYRNSRIYANLAAAKTALAEQLNMQGSQLRDGELVLARYFVNTSESGRLDPLNHNVHVVMGVVRIASGTQSSTEEPAKSMDFIYCGSEVTNKINAAINNLDVDEYSQANFNAETGKLTIYKIKEVDGKIVKGTGEEFDLGGYVDGKINNLDVTEYEQAVVSENKIEIKKIGETDGKIISTGTTTISVDGTVSTTNKLATQQTVKDAIEKLDVETPLTIVKMNSDNKKLQSTTISEENGVIAVSNEFTDLVEFNQALSATNKAATMADITASTISVSDEDENAVSVVVNGNDYTVSLGIDANDKVLTQSESGLKANLSMTYDSSAKKIYLKGKGTTPSVISEIDTSDFVKDGMITDVEVVNTAEDGISVATPYLKITWNTDASHNPTISRLPLNSLIDTYTADEVYVHMEGNKVEHKLQDTTTDGIGTPGRIYGTAAQTTHYGDTIKCLQMKVDAAGHVTKITETEVTLPSKQTAKDDLTMSVNGNKATITDTFTLDNTAQAGTSVFVEAADGLQITASGENGAKISHSSTYQSSADATAVVVDEAGESTTFNIPSLTIDTYGHVTGKKDTPVTITLPSSISTAVQSVVGEDGNPVNVSTNGTTVTVKLNTSAVNSVTATDSMDDSTNTHEYISSITVDEYGRVTGYTTTTMTEDFDCGYF